MSGSLLTRRAFGAFSLALLGGAAGCGTSRRGPPIRALPPQPGDDRVDAETLSTPEGDVIVDALDPQIGPRGARCVIVAFSDFQCPFCRDAALVLGRLRREHPDALRVVFKHLPTDLHRYAQAASIASQVVFLEAGTDAFWRYHDRLFANQDEIDDARLSAWARQEGVAADAIVNRAAEAERRVRDDVEAASRLGIHGTPHLYLNARVVDGYYPYETMKAWVDAEL